MRERTQKLINVFGMRAIPAQDAAWRRYGRSFVLRAGVYARPTLARGFSLRIKIIQHVAVLQTEFQRASFAVNMYVHIVHGAGCKARDKQRALRAALHFRVEPGRIIHIHRFKFGGICGDGRSVI